MTPEQAAVIMGELTVEFPNATVDQMRAKRWSARLADMDYDSSVRAVKVSVDKFTFFPQWAEFKNIYDGDMRRKKAAEVPALPVSTETPGFDWVTLRALGTPTGLADRRSTELLLMDLEEAWGTFPVLTRGGVGAEVLYVAARGPRRSRRISTATQPGTAVLGDVLQRVRAAPRPEGAATVGDIEDRKSDELR